MRRFRYAVPLFLLGMTAAVHATPINYNATSETLTFGTGQDATAALLGGSAIDPAGSAATVVAGSTWDLGNTNITAARALGNINVINFGTTDGGNEPVASVVAQYSASGNITFTNFGNGVNDTSTNLNAYSYGFNNSARNRSYTGVNNNAMETIGSTAAFNGGNVGTSYVDFDISSNTADIGVTTVGLTLSGPGDGSRDDGPGTWEVTLGNGTIVTVPLTVQLFDGTTDQPVWFGYTDTTGTGITHVHFEHNGGGGQPPVAIDDLSFVEGTVTPTPEPASLSFLALGALALIRRRHT